MVLCGFMGTGKSTLGPLIAKQLNFSFVDLDAWIEKEHRCTIADIFERSGEKYFRKCETEALQKVLLSQKQVISVGGGAVISDFNRSLIERKARLVCLKASTEELLKRLKKDTGRPLLQKADFEKTVEQLLKERLPIYNQISWQVETDNKSLSECVKEICIEWENPQLLSN
ncbi:hypothetical protein AB834_04585 [PVC group bacterium (ex Bugula neritina AB1)]|nr:hypothetical protein AB834_04585 [PVC group bacterium (ex Bugula neritina AB1)]